MHFYMPISKTEVRDDGTLYFEAIASSEAVDADGEVIKASAMREAIPDFMRYGTGALREMHQLMAAGTVDKAETGADGRTYICGTVVDPIAVRKMQTGTYKGVSIGGKAISREGAGNKIITKIKLSEISLVDRPANPDAVVSLWKVEDGAAERPVDALVEATMKEADAVQAEAELAKAAEQAPEEPAPAKPDPANRAAVALAALEGAVGKAEGQQARGMARAGLAKGFNDIARLADLLDALKWMLKSARVDVAIEGDGASGGVSELEAAGNLLIAALTIMIAKEAADLAQGEPDDSAIAAAETVAPSAFNALTKFLKETPDLANLVPWFEKAGARNSKKDAAKLQEAHDATVAAGAACGPMKADTAGDIAKAELLDTLAKRNAALDDMSARLETMTARVAKMERAPMPAKTFGTHASLTVITKEADAVGSGDSAKADVRLAVEDIEKMLAEMPEGERAMMLVKAALSRPIVPTTR